MGSCISCFYCNTVSVQVVLKLPHGQKGLIYHAGEFKPMESVQDWVQSLYSNSWSGWAAYNDETTVTNKKTKGHCKGVVTWNTSKIGWLIHSVPHFPTEITSTSISPILPSELVYGQSFVYLEMPYSNERLETILNQIEWMDANIFLQKNMINHPSYFSVTEVKQMIISPTISHYSKPSHYVMDIYGEHLCELDKSKWFVETWRRGSVIETVTPNLHDIKNLGWFAINYKESQDHSKWAVSKYHVWIGDLNRMESQMKRGGGGVMIRDADMVKAFRGLIIS
jgi:hypothetical protein